MNNKIGNRFLLKEFNKKDKYAFYECVSVSDSHALLKKVMKTKLSKKNSVKISLNELSKKQELKRNTDDWNKHFNQSDFYSDKSFRWLRREGKLFG